LNTINSNNRPREGSEEPVLKPAWGAVFAIAFGVVVMTAGHTLPVSLLTPLAADLGITEGLAGQTVTIASAVAFVTSLMIAFAARNLDRRVLLLVLALLHVVASLIVAVAPNLLVLLLGRMLFGIAFGGIWAFCAAVTMRLVPQALVPRALSLIFGGGGIASVAAIPIGSSLGSIVGWRAVFLIAAALALLALVWQFAALPSIPPRGRTRLATILHLLQHPQVRLGMLGVLLLFVGHNAFFTYLRPFLEVVTQVDVRELSGILLGSGIASVVGTSVAGAVVGWNLRLTLILVPLLMSVLAVGLVVFGSMPLVTAVLVALWGFAFSIIPVGWSTWLTRTVPDEAESAGGLFVATTQLAITLGAAAGGIVIDRSGAASTVVVSGIVLLLASVVTALGLRARSASPDHQAASGRSA
jgi:predicted MFS family arabinose efflux permease